MIWPWPVGEKYGATPKKLANIALQREGDTVEGWTERHGIQFMKVKANLTGKINGNSAMDELLSLGLNPEGEYSNLAFNFKEISFYIQVSSTGLLN